MQQRLLSKRTEYRPSDEGFRLALHHEIERYKQIKHKAKVVATKRKRSVRDKIETLLEQRQLAKEGDYYGYDS